MDDQEQEPMIRHPNASLRIRYPPLRLHPLRLGLCWIKAVNVRSLLRTVDFKVSYLVSSQQVLNKPDA